MSFPALKLSGNVANQYITAIEATYLNEPNVTKPLILKRVRYDIRRETKTFNVSGGTAQRYQDRPYNASRRIHTWIGYADVVTSSVSEMDVPLDSAQTTLNLNLIKKALVYYNSAGIPYSCPNATSQGSSDPSSTQAYEPAHDGNVNWVYDITSDGGSPPTYTEVETSGTPEGGCWFIRDINIANNLNGTSRVNFTFEAIEEWIDIAALIDALP